MSLRRENLDELPIILYEMFAVHLKIVCVYYIFVTLLIGGNKDSYFILSYLILSYPLSSWWNTNYLMPVPLHRFVCVMCGIRPVWSESSLPAWWNIGSSATHWAHIRISINPDPWHPYGGWFVLLKLKPIQTNIKGGRASNREKSRKRNENPYTNFPILVIL